MAYGQARAPLVPLCELVRIGRFAPSHVLSCNRLNDLTGHMRRGSPLPASGWVPRPLSPARCGQRRRSGNGFGVMIMDDNFDMGSLVGDAQLLFDHRTAQDYFGCSVFWIRRLAAIGGEEATIEDWQLKRDGTERGIVEITGRES